MKKLNNPETIKLLREFYYLPGAVNSLSLRDVVIYDQEVQWNLDDTYFTRLSAILKQLRDLEGEDVSRQLLDEPESWLKQLGLPTKIILRKEYKYGKDRKS